MLTYKLKIKNEIDVTPYCEAYSYMFRKLYANFELSEDKGFEKELRDKHNLDSWMYRNCKVEVKTKLEQYETTRNKKSEKIKELESSLSEETNSRKRYKIFKKLSYLKSHINKGIVFGGKLLLRRISYLSNLTNEESVTELQKLKDEFHKNRILPITIIGEAQEHSNRKFYFDFENNKVTFAPERKTKIPIEFFCGGRQYEQLCKLQQQIGKQAITVRLNNEYIWLSFDEQKLAGFNFNEKEYFKELKTIPKQLKEERKDCYKKWVQEQEGRIFKAKIKGRYIGFDLNPEFIAYAILEKTDDDFTIIHKEVVSFERLNTKLGLSSTDKEQIYQNNKRIHELNEAWKYIFNIAKHYKVAYCIKEELDFKDKGINEASKIANRKTNNLWHRTKTENLITKYCNTNGLKLIDVNPCYSSFIGNIKHDYFDPLNAAIEVTRRGIYKYLKGGFYPPLEGSDLDTMSQLGLDVQNKTISTWAKAFSLFKTAKIRYRRELKNFTEHNLKSSKSNVILYHFKQFITL